MHCAVEKQRESPGDWEQTMTPHAMPDAADVDSNLLDEFRTKSTTPCRPAYYCCVGHEDDAIGRPRFDSNFENYVAECSSCEYVVLCLLQLHFGHRVDDVLPEVAVDFVANLLSCFGEHLQN